MKRLAYFFVEILCSVDKYVTPRVTVNAVARRDLAQGNAPPDSASCIQTASSLRLSFHSFAIVFSTQNARKFNVPCSVIKPTQTWHEQHPKKICTEVYFSGSFSTFGVFVSKAGSRRARTIASLSQYFVAFFRPHREPAFDLIYFQIQFSPRKFRTLLSFR